MDYNTLHTALTDLQTPNTHFLNGEPVQYINLPKFVNDKRGIGIVARVRGVNTTEEEGEEVFIGIC